MKSSLSPILLTSLMLSALPSTAMEAPAQPPTVAAAPAGRSCCGTWRMPVLIMLTAGGIAKGIYSTLTSPVEDNGKPKPLAAGEIRRRLIRIYGSERNADAILGRRQVEEEPQAETGVEAAAEPEQNNDEL